MRSYRKTTDTQTIRILANILLGVIENKEMNKEEVKRILTEIHETGYCVIESKGDEEEDE